MATIWDALSESEKENVLFFNSLARCSSLETQRYKLLERFDELQDYVYPEKRDKFLEYFMLIMAKIDAYYRFLMQREFKKGLNLAATEVREKARLEKMTRKYVEQDTTEGTNSNDVNGFEDSFVDGMDSLNIKKEFEEMYGGQSE